MRKLIAVSIAAGLLVGTNPLSSMAQDVKPVVTQSAAEMRSQLDGWLFDAARRGDAEMIGTYIESHYDLNRSTPEGYTPLILAAYHGQTLVVDQLLVAGADACAKDKRGNTALMGAIFKGELRIAKRLLDAKCNADERNNAGQTPAMYAALFGRVELLDELRERGADMNAADVDGNTPTELLRGEIRIGVPR